MADETAHAVEEARTRLAALLTHPDDLTGKVAQLRSKFASEKASVDAILKTSVQSQLDDLQSGLFLLGNAQSVIAATKSNLATIDQVCLDAKAVIMNYPKIKKVSRTHQNFNATKNVVTRFQALNKDIERISALIAKDAAEPLGDAPNLLLVHRELFRLEEFRDQTMQRAKSHVARRIGPAVMQIVTKYFKRLDVLGETFRDYLWSLARNFLKLIQENQGSVVVRVAKIIDAEERADERVVASEQIRLNNPLLSEGGNFKVLAENPRQVKNFRSQLFNAIHDSITETFYAKLGGTEGDAVAALDKARFVFHDLALIFDELVPRFPPKYKIFPFYVLQYHKHVYDLCNRISSRNLETREILYMTSWIRDYYTSERMGVSEELLEPRLLDDNEAALTQEYIKLIKSKLVEWVDRILDGEATEFIMRDKPPDIDGEGLYASSAAVILFQMVNQQIDIAEDASRGGQLLLDVTVECLRVLQYVQTEQLKTMESEAAKFAHAAGSDDVPGGLPEYLMTWANNHYRCNEFMDILQKRLDAQLNEKHRAECSKHLSATRDGFMKVAKTGYQLLIDIIFRDVTPAFQQLHTPVWYEQQTMQTIIRTLEDYFQDFKKHLQNYLFSKLVTDAMDKFLVLYVESMRGGKSVKYRAPRAVAQMKVDVAACIRFWSEEKPAKRVKQAFDIVEKLIGIIESSPAMIFLSWYSLWKQYNDVPLAFIEDLLYKRDDIDKASIKEAIASCKAKAKEGNAEATTSVFSKLASEK